MGLTQEEVAVRLRCHVNSVRRLMKSLGLKVRPKSRIYGLNESFFETIDSEEKAYWLGFALADGSIKKTKYGTPCSLVVGLSSVDSHHLESLKTALRYTGPVKTINYFDKRYGKWYRRSQLEPSSRKLCSDLLDKGWDDFKRKGYIRILGEVLEKFMSALLRGLVDGDGCLLLNKYGSKTITLFHFTDLHQSVVEWVAVRVKEQLHIPIPKFLKNGNGTRKGFHIRYARHEHVRAIARFLYSGPPSLERKQTVADRLSSAVFFHPGCRKSGCIEP